MKVNVQNVTKSVNIKSDSNVKASNNSSDKSFNNALKTASFKKSNDQNVTKSDSSKTSVQDDKQNTKNTGDVKKTLVDDSKARTISNDDKSNSCSDNTYTKTTEDNQKNSVTDDKNIALNKNSINNNDDKKNIQNLNASKQNLSVNVDDLKNTTIKNSNTNDIKNNSIVDKNVDIKEIDIDDTDSNVDEKISKLDLDSIISILNTITQFISNKNLSSDGDMQNSIAQEVSALIDEKYKDSKDGVLSFFNSIDNEKLNIKDVLLSFKESLENSNVIDMKDSKALNSIINSLKDKIDDNNILTENFGDAISSSILSNQTTNNTDLDNKVLESIPVKNQDIVSEDIQSKVNSDFSQTQKLLSDIKKVINDKVNSENNQVSNSNTSYDMKDSSSDGNQNLSQSKNSDFSEFLSEKSDEDILKSILDDGDGSHVINRTSVFSNMMNKSTDAKAISNENMVIRRENVAEDLIKSIKYMQTENLKELTVKINPKNLGEMTIKILQEDGMLKAQIRASSKESYDLLSRNSVVISKELTNQNIKIQDVNISMNDDTTYFKGSSFENGQRSNGHENLNQNNSKEMHISNSETDFEEDNEADLISNIDMLA